MLQNSHSNPYLWMVSKKYDNITVQNVASLFPHLGCKSVVWWELLSVDSSMAVMPHCSWFSEITNTARHIVFDLKVESKERLKSISHSCSSVHIGASKLYFLASGGHPTTQSIRSRGLRLRTFIELFSDEAPIFSRATFCISWILSRLCFDRWKLGIFCLSQE